MATDTPMTDARLEEIERRVQENDADPIDARELLAEVKRLRALKDKFGRCLGCGLKDYHGEGCLFVDAPAASRPATSPETCPQCNSADPEVRGWRYIHFGKEYVERPYRLDKQGTGDKHMEFCRHPFHSRAR